MIHNESTNHLTYDNLHVACDKGSKQFTTFTTFVNELNNYYILNTIL